ncbi:unnamed protein product [Peniophora sp. CBMAI 1063]|nr:unnamed protein product [Peniophora sp. CBMAI 1063]
MSSDEDDPSAAGPSASKRRRPTRSNNACDLCRKRKVRCDGKQFSTGKCTNCSDYGRDCTFTITAKKFPPGYVAALETKVKRLESLIRKLLPGQDFTHEVGFELNRDNWMLPGVCGAPEPESPSLFLAAPAPTTGNIDSAVSSALSVMGSANSSPTTPMQDDHHESDEDTRERTTKLQNLRNATAPSAKSSLLAGYLGRSSATELVRKAFEMRAALAPEEQGSTFKRSRLWKRPAWLLASEDAHMPQPHIFPDQDLMDELVDHYFANANTLTPVLHRPTFEKDLKSSLHLRERSFGNVVLLVCAIGSRFTHDRRVLVEGDPTWHSAGWNMFMQTRIFDDASLLFPTSHLHVLQAACLATSYTADISPIHTWMIVGSGIRFALDIGAHKRRAYGSKPALEDELYKRSFWTLVYFDRIVSAGMGRPRTIQEEDFDLEMPLCCDDEYLTLEDPEQASTQPSLISYFVWVLKLSQIQGLALRTIYASAKARVHYNFRGEDWMNTTVAHLDSLLNGWADSVPDHLRWDPARTDDTFFSQSAHLHLQYRATQLLIHRPSIAARGLKPLPTLSLVVCTGAARSIARVADALNKRKPDHLGALDVLMWTLGMSALVLLVNVANARLSNTPIDRTRAMEDFDLLLSILRDREERWLSAGRQVDVLESFRPMGEAADEPQLTAQRKRPREEAPPDIPQQLSYAIDEPPSIFLSQPEIAPAHNIPHGTTLNQSVLNGHHMPEQAVADGSSYASPLIGSQSQSAGSVLGNVDFGALFGLGNATLEGVRPWSPAPHDGTLDPYSAAPSTGNRETTILRPEEWAGMALDLGMDDWNHQWMMPSQSGSWDQGFGGGSGG